MDDLIELVNRIQRSCTLLEDHGAATDTLSLPTLWSSLPSVVVVGGQSSGKSSVLESIVGKDFLPRGFGIVTRRPLVVQLHKTDGTEAEYAEFLHIPKKRFLDFCAVRREIEEETDRVTRHTKQISPRPIHLSIYSPHVVNLTLIDLPGLTNVAVGGQADTVVAEIENLVRSYAEKPNSLILAISPANQDIATSDAIKLARDVDPSGNRTYGVLTKLDLMDKGTNARDVLEGRAYHLKHPWVGVINRSQADINMGIDMMAARKKEREYFASSLDYKHLEGRMGSEYLAKLLSKNLKDVIKAKIPSIQSLTNRTIAELETELKSYGNPVFVDAGERLYKILDICRAFDCIFKDHLEGRRAGGEQIYLVFEKSLPAALKSLPFDGQLSLQNIRKVISEADGYLPHLVAPEQGYRRLIEGSLSYFKPPAEASVNRVHHILKGLVQKSISETEGLKHFPNLREEIYAAATESLERFRTDSMKTALRLVEMESSYLTVDFFRRLPQEVERSGNATGSIFDRYTEAHLRRIGSNVLSYVRMVCETLKNSIPKAVVHCQVRESKNALLDHFYITIGKKEANQLASLLNEDPRVVVQREACAKRLELFRNARDEIEAVTWT